MDVRCSTTQICEDLTDRELATRWKEIPLGVARSYVNKLQTRIAKAVKEGKHRLARRLQYLLTHSFYAKVLAVKTVTENKGKRTPGVDGILWNTPQQKMKATLSLFDKGYRAQPLNRIYIPKPNSTKKRPLSIPTFYDRAMQALYAMALQPWAETTADRTSFGFRKFRGAHDAMQYIFNCMSKPWSAEFVLEGDIRSCFDCISHEWLLKHIPMDKGILKQFLKSGYMFEGAHYETLMGTPQGGLISPILANMALDGMEILLKSRFKERKVNLIRYADDFVVTAETREIAEEVREFIEIFLSERGLTLSEEKTKVVHINDGFDFLSWNFRKYGGKMLIKPSKKSIDSVTHAISEIIKNAKGWSQEQLINRLNPIILGWAQYHRNVVSAAIFGKLNHIIWGMLWHWAKRRHPDKGKHWIVRRYWHSISTSNWVFTTFASTLRLFTNTKIKRHLLIKMEFNPYLDHEYFTKRYLGDTTKQTKITFSYTVP